MELEEAAKAFKALSDPTRLKIVTCLMCCDQDVSITDEGDVSPASGLTAGQVCCHITGSEQVTSTVSFHLKELRNAGLINMKKEGRFMICRVNAAKVEELKGSLKACSHEEAACSCGC